MKRIDPIHRPPSLSALCVMGAAAVIFAAAAPLVAIADRNSPPGKVGAAPPHSLTVSTTHAPSPLPAHGINLTEEDKIVHVLNRLGYGPRPGDVEKVKALGLDRYIAQQLNPDRIDDSAVDRKLAAFTELQLSADQLETDYHDMLQSSRKQQALRKQMQKKDAGGATGAPNLEPATGPATTPPAVNTAKRPIAMDPAMRREAMQSRQAILQTALPVARAHEEFVTAKSLRAVESERQLQEELVDFWGNHFNIDIRKAPCGVLKIIDDRETIRPHILGKFRELLGASAKSPAMLVYLDNFQSISENAQTGPAGRMPANRARRLQRLQRMLAAAGTGTAGQPSSTVAGTGAVGQQPSAVAGTGAAGQPPAVTPPQPQRKRPGGLNENYAREIMELHTLGVDGGYTQEDVREVARCFTGWSIASAGGRRPGAGKYAEAGAYRFYPAMHDNGEKRVLGQVIPAGGGEKDGEKVLDILASHPATMRHVSEQLCQRLAADEPPASLVSKCVATWKRTDGDLREIVRTIVTSPEFYSPAAYRTKIKSPFEYAVSSVRALGATYENAAVSASMQPRKAMLMIKPPKGGGYLDLDTVSLVGQVGTMGQPLFQYQAPTGYPEDSRKWVSSGALISRLNFALALTNGKLADVKVNMIDAAESGDTDRSLDRMAAQILHTALSPSTRTTLQKQVRLVSDGPAERQNGSANSRVAALLLGSPEFQRK